MYWGTPMLFGLPWFVVMIAIVVLIMLSRASQRRRWVDMDLDLQQKRGNESKTCPSCGSDNPTMAQFCRRCGVKL
jgi:ribosomal protein L40E